MRFPSVENNPEQQTSPQHSKLRDDPKFAATKMAIFQYTAVAIFLFLVTGFWELQIKNPEIYNERAERNRIKSLPIVAPRGKILDRDGRVIVDNHSTWSLILSRENLKTEHLHEIADGLHLDYDDLLRKVQRYRKRPKYEPIIIKEELTPADMAFVASHQDPETFPEMETIRVAAPALSAERRPRACHRIYRRNQRIGTRRPGVREIQSGANRRQDRHREAI